mmetsp:Transcript_72339/g.215886  ORF Transcript_72339/g.215886 Transcript_72339/m.215886 type:complete len:317 (-) Transcript_72339:442-1392(-)
MSTAVDKVTVENEHGRIRHVGAAIGPEEQEEFPKLAVQIPKDFAGCGRLDHRRLRGEDLAGRVGNQYERVEILRAEQVLDEAARGPVGVEHVRGRSGDLLAEVPRLVQHQPAETAHGVQHPASALQVLRGVHLFAHEGAGECVKVQVCGMQQVPNQHAPGRHKFVIRARDRPPPQRQLLQGWLAGQGILRAVGSPPVQLLGHRCLRWPLVNDVCVHCPYPDPPLGRVVEVVDVLDTDAMRRLLVAGTLAGPGKHYAPEAPGGALHRNRKVHRVQAHGPPLGSCAGSLGPVLLRVHEAQRGPQPPAQADVAGGDPAA